MNQIKGVLRIFSARLIGFFIFIILLLIANVLMDYIKNDMFNSIVGFINDNLLLIISFSLILMIGEMFEILEFPFNLPYPLFNAVGWVLLLNFLFKIFKIIFSIIDIYKSIPWDSIQFIVTVLIFIMLLIVGYIKIIGNLFKPKKIEKQISNSHQKMNSPSLEDIGKEIKGVSYDLLKKARGKIKDKPKKNKKI